MALVKFKGKDEKEYPPYRKPHFVLRALKCIWDTILGVLLGTLLFVLSPILIPVLLIACKDIEEDMT